MQPMKRKPRVSPTIPTMTGDSRTDRALLTLAGLVVEIALERSCSGRTSPEEPAHTEEEAMRRQKTRADPPTDHTYGPAANRVETAESPPG